jgi:hypothetical protein
LSAFGSDFLVSRSSAGTTRLLDGRESTDLVVVVGIAVAVVGVSIIGVGGGGGDSDDVWVWVFAGVLCTAASFALCGIRANSWPMPIFGRGFLGIAFSLVPVSPLG